MGGIGGSLLSYAKSLTLIPKLASVATDGCSDAALTDAFMGFEIFRCCGSSLEDLTYRDIRIFLFSRNRLLRQPYMTRYDLRYQ
jgi:hypothetical protein